MSDFIENIKFNKEGLVPCIAQDCTTREVLMMAWMDEEALKLTMECGYATYFSRSRNTLWKKGKTSGNTQKVVSLTYDCDGDTILVIVEQTGVACHTGNKTCFFSPQKPSFLQGNEVLEEDYAVIKDRKNNPKEGSYTNYLFDKGQDKICKKIGEECTEIIIAVKNDDKDEMIYEISDFIYHLMVLMVNENIKWNDIYQELINRRMQNSES